MTAFLLGGVATSVSRKDGSAARHKLGSNIASIKVEEIYLH